ncbi:MAG: hypothetical protein JSR34_12350 [Proteobacteria bacterium]|nr:hypothetical protein [Pseudomonadota bacterium]
MSSPESNRLKQAGEHLSMARDHLVVGVADAAQATSRAARVIKDEAGDGLDSLLEAGREALARTGEAVRRHPKLAVGGAIAVGYLLTRILRRR